jgi:gamma-glutamylaminecyclotransferase
MPFVFVYGTLKRGDCRHGHLAGSVFVGEAVTAAGYRLFHLGDYPGLLDEAGGGSIEGELYEVTDGQLRALDDVEGVDENWYARRPIRLEAPFTDLPAEAYFFLGDVRGMRERKRRWDVPDADGG